MADRARAPRRGRRALPPPSPSRPLPNIPFNLPFIPLEIILTQLTAFEIITFALSSESSRNLIENNFKAPVKSLKIIQSYGQPRITVDFAENDSLTYGFWRVNLGVPEYEAKEYWGVQVWVFMNAVNDDFEFHFKSNTDLETFFLMFSRFLLRSLQTDTVILRSHYITNKKNLLSMLRWRPAPRISGMQIEWMDPKSTVDLGMMLGAANQLNLYVYLPKVKYEGPMTVRTLQTSCASWLTLTCLKNMKTEQVKAEGLMLTANEINELLKHWRSGGFTQDFNLFAFTPHERFPINEDNLSVVLEGLEATKEAPEGLNFGRNSDRVWTYKMPSGDPVTVYLEKDSEEIMITGWNQERIARFEGKRIDLCTFYRFCSTFLNRELVV